MGPGTILSERYEIVRLLGSGGMAHVYEGIDLTLGRRVSLKVNTGVLAGQELIDRFHREARAVAALAHPNILQIYDYRAEKNVVYFAGELLNGVSLREKLSASGPLPTPEALAIAVQIVAALEAAHEMGIIHRDLKPANIFCCSSGVVKLLDFGLAAWASGANGTDAIGELTGSGVICGTLGYLSPEQARGEPAEFRSDFFSLGCVMYEMLAGHAPFRAAAAAQSLYLTINCDPSSLCGSAPNTPLWLERVIRQCLMKSPTDRPENARALRRTLTSHHPKEHHPRITRDAGGALRLLILDDNPLVLRLFRALAEREGYVVTTTGSWIEFNHVLEGGEFDLILLDERLPSILGSRLSQKLREKSRFDSVPIILFSDHLETELRVPLDQAGADRFVRKPWTREKIAEIVTQFFPPRVASTLPEVSLPAAIDPDAETPRMP